MTYSHSDDSESDALLHGVLLLTADNLLLVASLLTDLLPDFEVQNGRLLERMGTVLESEILG